MNYKVLITSNLDTTLYKNTIAEYERLFPDDPSQYLLNIEKYILKGDIDEAMQSVDKLEKIVGGDEYLNLYRGLFYAAQGELEKGMPLVDHYIKNHVKDPDGYWSRFQIYIITNQPDKAIQTINDINKYTKFSRLEITDKVEVDYPDFAESPLFMDWKETWIKRRNERNKWRPDFQN